MKEDTDQEAGYQPEKGDPPKGVGAPRGIEVNGAKTQSTFDKLKCIPFGRDRHGFSTVVNETGTCDPTEFQPLRERLSERRTA